MECEPITFESGRRLCPWCQRRYEPQELPGECPKRPEGRFYGQSKLTPEEQASLFPDLNDPALLGNIIAQMTDSIGVPPCSGCKSRQRWLNRAHAWLIRMALAER
jgi:hypothetical protein